jgi:outer membrane lipoprotein
MRLRREYVSNKKAGWHMRTFALPLLLLALAVSCAPAIPRDVLQGASSEPRVHEVQQTPERHLGKSVLWGGRILSAENRREGTLLEILKLPLDASDRPQRGDRAQGRFLYLHPDYLDKAVYSEGREVTVVGRITRIEVRTMDQIEYPYPVLEGKVVHLWEERQERPRGIDYPPPYWGPPYWGRHPYWW